MFSRSSSFRMTDTLLKETIRQFMQQGGQQVSFGWQGGEPTLMGLRFYQKAIDFQQRFGRGQTVGNGMQTNGIVIDHEWAAFLAKYHFLVGLSLDGSKHIHDRYRVLPHGASSWQQVQDSAKRLLDAGVAVNALTVVSEYAVQFPEEIYNFHKSLGLRYMQFIPCVEFGTGQTETLAPFSTPPEAYGTFLITLFDLWMRDFQNGRPTTSIRFFESLLFCYTGQPAPECTLRPECGTYLVVEHNGDVFPCDFFVEPEERLGNVMENSLTALLNSERQLAFGTRKRQLPQTCRECPWLRCCFGGCPKDRIRSTSDEYMNHLCQSYRMFFEHADVTLRNLTKSMSGEKSPAIKRKRHR